MRISERQGVETAPLTIKIGTIKSGTCDFHGTINPLEPDFRDGGRFQYQLCGCFVYVG